MLKETTGAFDGALTHDWQASTDYESDVLPTAPSRPSPAVSVIPKGVHINKTYIIINHSNNAWPNEVTNLTIQQVVLKKLKMFCVILRGVNESYNNV